MYFCLTNKSMKDFLDHRLFDSRIKTEHVTRAEQVVGYFIGPFSVLVMNSILNNYLNVYYTDVIDVGSIWGGWFLSLFPIVVKAIDAFTFVLMGIIVDRTHSRQGKARPWILLSAPLLCISLVLLFVVPTRHEMIMALWIFLSYNLFYSVAYTAYNTAHTLTVPLSTRNVDERSKLSVTTNAQGMLSGTFVAVLFPTVIVPAMGTNRLSWILCMSIVAVASFPFLLGEYYFTRERVTETLPQNGVPPKPDLKRQLKLCLKSRSWIVLMGYLLLLHTINCLHSASIFYYCNWVLGSYNDGITQFLYYAVGNAPQGLGLFLARPICNKLGRRRAMQGGFLLAALGVLLCVLNPRNLTMVLIGQCVKSIGLIPATFMTNALLGDALDDVERVSGERCDGFSSSVFNVIITLSTGLSLFVLNTGLTQLGYIAPSTVSELPVQPAGVQSFIIIATLGCQLAVYPLLAWILKFFDSGHKAA